MGQPVEGEEGGDELSRYEIRAATCADHADLCELAGYLDTVNLPRDAAALEETLRVSEASFQGQIPDPRLRTHVFVLRDLQRDKAIGTSMVIGQLGQREAPYIYFDVRREERYSATLDRHFVHRVLSIGYSYAGPTEIGGLVLHPDCRRSHLKLGRLISFVRFLWIAMHRAQFQDQLLAELLPPLEPDGTSLLWEAVGRRFTGLSYLEADRLSKHNKEFIRGLFPEGDIYVSLLAPEAQAVVGQVGEQTRGVEKMLRAIGFRHSDRIDPFDGGPHFVAATDLVRPVREARLVRLEALKPVSQTGTSQSPTSVPGSEGPRRWLMALEYPAAPYLRARLVDGRRIGDVLQITSDDAAPMNGSWAWCTPF